MEILGAGRPLLSFARVIESDLGSDPGSIT